MNDLFANDSTTQRREFGRIYPPRPHWLAKQVPEPILEPDLPIIDTHYHVFDVPGYRYLADELLADLSTGHRVVATVFAEAQTMYRKDGPEPLRPVGETEFVARMAESGPVTNGIPLLGTGIVGFADLALGSAVEEVLAAHVVAGKGRFKGVRYTTARDPSPQIVVHSKSPPGVMGNPQWHAGLRVLARMGLSLDSWVFFHQLDEFAAVADLVPELDIVLGHCGGLLGYGPYTGRRDEVFATWRKSMQSLSRRPHVSVKLGGMLQRLASYDYLNVGVPSSSSELADCMRPYIETCIELFGADRCMFESNYPVEKSMTGYAVLWNTFKRITAGATDAEKQALYSGTARRVYRLPGE